MHPQIQAKDGDGRSKVRVDSLTSWGNRHASLTGIAVAWSFCSLYPTSFFFLLLTRCCLVYLEKVCVLEGLGQHGMEEWARF